MQQQICMSIHNNLIVVRTKQADMPRPNFAVQHGRFQTVVSVHIPDYYWPLMHLYTGRIILIVAGENSDATIGKNSSKNWSSK